MAKYIANLTTGQLDEKGFHRLFGVLLNQSGVIQSGSMVVAAQDTPDMTVKVAGGATGHDVVFITTAGDTYHGWNTASENVTITANSSGVVKTDAIVAYADLASGIATSNNPGALKYVAVRRGSTSTGNPTSGEIDTAVSSNPYVVLAYVTVANGASSINSGNLTDARVRATLAANTVATAAIQDSAVTAAKIGAVVTTSTFNLSLNNAAITSLVTTAISGSATSNPSIARCEGVVSLSSLSIPATALILEAHLWVNAAGNLANTGYFPLEATAVSTSSATFKGIMIGDGSASNNFPNVSNSKLQGYVRYIAS